MPSSCCTATPRTDIGAVPRINVNADVGEGAGQEEVILGLVDSASVACGVTVVCIEATNRDQPKASPRVQQTVDCCTAGATAAAGISMTISMAEIRHNQSALLATSHEHG